MSHYAICDKQSQILYEISDSQWRKNCEEKALLLRYLAVPLKENDEKIWLAIDDENNLNATEIFAFLTHKQVEPVLVEREELNYLLKRLSPDEHKEWGEHNLDEPSAETSSIMLDFSDPIIQILDNLFKYCLENSASDIHLEPHKNTLGIRLRIDGVLYLYKNLPLYFSTRILSRLKLLAKLDISETRLPQDGQFSFTTALNETLDFRVSTLPTHYGEKMVLRLQKNKPATLDFTALGLTSDQQMLFKQALAQPQGLILVTGPTGSGKSITLYSALAYLNKPEKHILTAEDPIEIEMEGIIQTQVNRGLNLDFSRLLRTFLRQDPDIIMLGEIRDEESARMALRASQTGHLVLSTLHTNDAPSAIERLLQLGINEYEIKNTLLLVIAQRLVRKSCPQCQGSGCEACHHGYKGRIGVFQCFSRVANSFDFATACLDYPSLLESAKQKVREKITDQAEITRVLGND